MSFSSAMHRHGVSMLALMMLCAGTARAEEATDGERLLFALPDGWHEVYAGREGELSTTEYVPEGQSADDWKEMLTVQIVVGRADADPDRMLSGIVAHLGRACPPFNAQPVELGGTGDYPTLAVILMCGQQPDTDYGEFTLLRGIAGHENFYLLQKSWRTKPYRVSDDPPVSLDDRKLWLGFLAYQRVCNPAAGECPAEIEAGNEP